MNGYIRTTKLHNIVGRARYITDPARQEHLICCSPSVDWMPYQQFERSHRRSSKANNEGREEIVSLPNGWAELQKDELKARCDQLALSILPDGIEYQWAVHYNHDMTNLHLHLIYSERVRESDPKTYDRDIYLTDDGKVARSKAQRARNPDGSYKPPVHRKGDTMGEFGPKDPRFTQRGWLQQAKQTMWGIMEQYGAAVEQYDQSTGKLPQQHVGKNLRSDQADAVREYNAMVMEYNALIDEGRVEKDFALEVQQNVSKAPRKAPVLQEALETIKSAERLQEATEKPLQAITANAEQRSAPEPEEDDDLIFELLLDLMRRARTRLDEEEEPEEESETQQEQSSVTVVWVDMINLSVSPLVGYYAIDTDGRLWVMDPQPQIESPQLGDKVDPRKGMRLGDEYDIEYLEKKLGISDREQPRDGLQAYIESIQRQEQPKDALQQYIELIRQREQHKPSKSEEIDR